MLDIKEEIIKKERERKKMVQGQIKELKKDIEEMIGMEINEELWDKINTLIIKVGQYKEISMNELEEIMKDKVKPIVKKYKEDMSHSFEVEPFSWEAGIERLFYRIDPNDNKIAIVSMLWENMIIRFEVDTMTDEHLERFAKTLE